MEIIYATYLSALQRGRIDLPLTYDNNAFLETLDASVFPDTVAHVSTAVS